MADKTDSIPLNKYHRIADSLFHLKKYDAAIINFRKAEEAYHLGKEWEQEVICLNAIGDIERKLGEHDKSIESLDKSLDVGLTYLDENNEHLANTFYLKGVNYFLKGNYYKAIYSEQEAVKRWAFVFGDQSFYVAKGCNLIGLSYRNIGRFDMAEDYLKRALKISEKELDSLHPGIGMIANNLSVVYKEKGDFDQALKYSKRAVYITLNNSPVDSISLAKKYNNTGMIYISLNDTVSAYNYYKKALDIRLAKLKSDHLDLAESYNNMGRISRVECRYDLALDYYYKSLEIYNKTYKEIHPRIADCYNNISNIYKEKGDFDKAIHFNSKALYMLRGFYRENHPDIANCLLNFGDIYNKKAEYGIALKNLDLAINANTFNGQILSPREQLFILSKKSQVFVDRFYAATNDTLDLIRAIAVLRDISKLTDDLRKSYESKGSMLALSKMVSKTFLEAIRISHYLFEITGNKNYLETAFFFAEKNKANVLVEAMLESRSQTYSGILDDLIEQEKTLKIKLEDCDQRRKKEIFNKGNRDKIKMKNLEHEFTSLNASYDSLIKVFEKNYQSYFLLKYSTSILTVKDVKQRISPGAVMIEYITSDSVLFIFSIMKNEFLVTKVRTDSIDHYVRKLRKSLSEMSIKNLNQRSIDSYRSAANRLYSLLIKPVEDRMQASELIIVPDGKLGYIPFETLLTELHPGLHIDFKNLNYLINKYSISYGNSATIHFDILNSLKCNAENGFLGIAPFTQRNTNYQYRDNGDTIKLSGLPSSKQEVESIQKMIGGRIFEDSSATLRNFLAEAANFKILHIATHGDVDDKHPLESRLYFFPDDHKSELQIFDLFGLNFNSELAVLSACNTGYGKLEKGEGIMSLARGFSYAGVPGVAMSLWNVNDKSTSEIMNGFYFYLKKGLTRNEALRQAKLDYIEKSDQVFASPYYWGGFVYIGKNDAIDFKNGRRNYWLLLFIVPVLGLAFIYLRRGKKEQS
jgi:CHAT domain-containing protein/Tfp pilus assembly protein PilF